MAGFNRFLAATALAAAVGIGGSAQAATNFVTNGNFATPNELGNWAAVPNDPIGSGWQGSDSGSYEVGNSGIYGLPCISTGCQNAEVNYNGFDKLSQQISGLTAGKTYNLTFDYGGRNDGGPQKLEVYFTNAGENPTQVLLGTVTSVGNAENSGWSYHWYGVKPTSTSGTLSFESLNVGGTPGYGSELTNVSFTDVPEPAAWALMLLGFGGMGAALRMRRRVALVTA